MIKKQTLRFAPVVLAVFFLMLLAVLGLTFSATLDTAHADGHEHHFITFEVGTSGGYDYLYAYCDNADGACDLTNQCAWCMLTGQASTTYTGSSVDTSNVVYWWNNAVFTEKTGIDPTAFEFVYSGTSYAGVDYESSTTAPTDAGTYTATVTVVIDSVDYVLNKSFEIAKGGPNLYVNINSSYTSSYKNTYDGTEKAVIDEAAYLEACGGEAYWDLEYQVYENNDFQPNQLLELSLPPQQFKQSRFHLPDLEQHLFQ